MSTVVRIQNIIMRTNSHVVIALTDIYGIGTPTAVKICATVNVNPATRIKDLTEDEVSQIREMIAGMTVEGDLRRRVSAAIKRLGDIKCYRGLRHRSSLPVRGQRTRTNARTRKGKSKGVK